MDAFRKAVETFLKAETKLKEFHLETPPKPELGDYAFPCFVLAKEWKKPPQEIAKTLMSKFIPTKHLKKVTAVGPYLNFFTNKDALTKDVLTTILKEKEEFGSSKEGKGKTILMEHTSINPNASPHVGRARNALLGDAIVRILRFQQYKVDVHYLVNDVGKQIAMVVLAAKGKKSVKFHDLLDLYIAINKKAEKDQAIEKQAFELLHQLENGNKTVRKNFREVVDVCIKGQKEIFNDLGIKYDHYDYESQYLWSKKTDEVLKLLEKTGKLFIDGHDRWVMDLKGYGLGMEVPVMVMTRADKTSLYGLRDVCYTIEKMERGDNIQVLGEDQKLYSEQISAVMKELKLPHPRVVHYSFVLLKEGKMSTRKGNVVLLEDFMKETVKKANKEIKKRWKKENNEAAKIIGYGALKYSILRVSPEKSVTFDLDQALSFEGETAPYIQYAYARISSILKKHGKKVGTFDPALLIGKGEIDLIKHLGEFPAIVKKASDELAPHLVANYSYTLAQKFNEFYHYYPVLQEKEDLKNARLALISCVHHTLKTGLSLMGIGVLEKM